MKRSFKRVLTIATLTILPVALIVIFFGLQYWLWLGKIHVVFPGQVYRSAQLSLPQFSKAIEQHHFRSILNLRKISVEQEYYRAELKLSTQKNIAYYSVPMHSSMMPSKTQLLQLVNILQTSPKPLLIHCEGGADRTGLVSAMYLILQNQSVVQAEKQFSLNYYVINHSSAGKQVFPPYVAWLQKNRLTSSRQNFLEWLEQP